MCFRYTAFALTCCVIFQCTAQDGKSKEEVEEQDDKTEYDSHTFVALIDIVFSDGTKRSCTGAIIHDNVVITAAHCFVHAFDENIKPELTASFVVIGSKKMFDTGYEQYLPIERILTHPDFHGWSADLSLVYTFAGMTSDKPGKIIPLAGERMSNPVDSNVTVFSWGHGKDGEIDNNWQITNPTTPCPESSSNEDNMDPEDNQRVRITAGILPNHVRKRQKEQHKLVQKKHQGKITATRQPHRFRTQFRNINPKDLLYQYPLLQQKVRDKELTEMTVRRQRFTSTKQLSRYLSSNEDDTEGRLHRLCEPRSDPNSTFSPLMTNRALEARIRGHLVQRSSLKPLENIKTFYKNWRRNMGSQQNRLTVELFGFVNLATCKKIVEGAMPSRYEIKNGEVSCYSSEEHYLTDEDSGAPAVRHGQLVAVTLGGAQCDGDQVGVGMKMSCYCNWIADNLPGATEMNCCKNCCGDNKHTDDAPTRGGLRHGNKYLFK